MIHDHHTVITCHVFQMDLKGIPAFIMNQVLKRHPLALHYIRIQLTDPRAAMSKSMIYGTESDDEEVSEAKDYARTI